VVFDPGKIDLFFLGLRTTFAGGCACIRNRVGKLAGRGFSDQGLSSSSFPVSDGLQDTIRRVENPRFRLQDEKSPDSWKSLDFRKTGSFRTLATGDTRGTVTHSKFAKFATFRRNPDFSDPRVENLTFRVVGLEIVKSDRNFRFFEVLGTGDTRGNVTHSRNPPVFEV